MKYYPYFDHAVPGLVVANKKTGFGPGAPTEGTVFIHLTTKDQLISQGINSDKFRDQLYQGRSLLQRSNRA